MTPSSPRSPRETVSQLSDREPGTGNDPLPLRAMKTLLRALPLLLLSTALFAQRPLEVGDFAKFRDVSGPRLSPDGKLVLYTVRETDMEEDKRRTHIWVVSMDGRENRQLTFSKSSESTPRWSPDGKWIAFLSSRANEDGIDELWIMPAAGGEAEKVTTFKGSVAELAWAPDSNRLALIVEDPEPGSDDDKDKNSDKPKAKKTKPPIVVNRFQFKVDRVGYLTTKRQHLYLFDHAGKKSELLTPGPFNEYQPSWSPDGSLIAFVSKHGDDPDRTDNFDIFVVEPKAGATARQITTYVGADNDPERDSPPAWSPDGKWIAFVKGGDPGLIYYAVRHLAIVPAAGGPDRVLTASLDRNPREPEWSADGSSLTFLLEDDRSELLERIPATGGAPQVVVGGKQVVLGHDRDVILRTDDLHPPEVYTIDGRQLTHHNDELLAKLRLGTVEEIESKSKDGTLIHGFIVKPPGYQPGQSYPAVLRIHGGPVSQFRHELSFEWQLLAANGYLVIGANPRGSSGRGQAFSRAIWADWGHLDAQDVLSAVDYAVARSLADPKRLGVGGWSYGGILTNYVIAQDPRFKAATSGASISNVLAGYGTDMYVREYEAELGTPWQHPEVWAKISYPFLHADRIVTPTLFLAGESDFNVPLLNSEQMYQALRSLGRATALIIYPGQFHGLTKPSYIKDRYERYLAWYAKYMK
jgi:dipeptidyl aminopeptidase/acylaminoacyl peptidase